MQRIAAGLQRTVWRGNDERGILSVMISKIILGALGAVLVAFPAFLRMLEAPPPPSANVPEYTSDGQMKLPEHYREWIYLSTGFDMSYSAGGMQMDHHMFDNVFVNPEAYKVFAETGRWPDK